MNHPSLLPPNNSSSNDNHQGEEKEDDDDDVVVQEIGVFLSTLEMPDDQNVAISSNSVTNSTNHRTYLMQYPGHWNHHQRRDDSMECPVSVRIKPRHNILEAEHDTNHHHRSSNNNDSNDHDASFTTNTRTYESQTIPMNTHLCLGKYVTKTCPKNNNGDDDDDSSPTTTTTTTELHLIPITHVTQMRPSFQHFRASTEMMEDTTVSDDPTNNNNTTTTTTANNNNAPTTIAYQRKESDRAYQVRQSSFAHYLANLESEPFTPLHVTGAIQEDTPGRMTTTTTNQSLFASYHREQYRQSLNYLRPTTTTTSTTTTPSQTPVLVPPTKNDTHSQQQQQRNTKRILTTILPILQESNGPVPFSILQLAVQNSRTLDPSLTHTDHSNNDDDDDDENDDTTCLWSILNTVAVLVRGNWYIHSKFMTILPHPSILSRDRKQQSAALKGPILSVSSSNNNNHTAPVILVGSQANHQQQMYKVQQQRIRTFGLLLLHLYGKIDKARFLRAYRQRTTAETDREDNFIGTVILQQLARPVRAGYWVGRIIMDDDSSGIDDGAAATPEDVVARHNHYWQSMRQRFQKELQFYDDTHVGTNKSNVM